MSDSQLLTIALAAAPTMLTVLVRILTNNARLKVNPPAPNMPRRARPVAGGIGRWRIALGFVW